MYIDEVIERVMSYSPSEYDKNEMYLWCDEVSAMLTVEDRNVFSEAVIMPDRNGRLVVPDNIPFENIVSVVYGGRLLRKEDLRHSVLRNDKSTVAPVTVIYLMPFKPIRQVSYNGEADYDKTSKRLTLGKNGFLKGDIAIITKDSEEYEAMVLGVGTLGDRYYIDITDTLPESFSGTDIKIRRTITDKTVCLPPYDTMYIDYCLAKQGLYQHDFNTYNQFMTSFNSRLAAYKKYMANHMPQADLKFINWW